MISLFSDSPSIIPREIDPACLIITDLGIVLLLIDLMEPESLNNS